ERGGRARDRRRPGRDGGPVSVEPSPGRVRSRLHRDPRQDLTAPVVTLPSDLAALAPLVVLPRRSAVLVDCAGSLAPTVDDPAPARPLPAALDAMARLAASLACCAVVSGRPLSFLAEHVRVPGVSLIGLYGLERMVDGARWRDPRAEPYV